MINVLQAKRSEMTSWVWAKVFEIAKEMAAEWKIGSLTL